MYFIVSLHHLGCASIDDVMVVVSVGMGFQRNTRSQPTDSLFLAGPMQQHGQVASPLLRSGTSAHCTGIPTDAPMLRGLRVSAYAHAP